ncbi:unnamed protein product, partial [marine sediment metagenome]
EWAIDTTNYLLHTIRIWEDDGRPSWGDDGDDELV